MAAAFAELACDFIFSAPIEPSFANRRPLEQFAIAAVLNNVYIPLLLLLVGDSSDEGR
jgi:hypothetical protein